MRLRRDWRVVPFRAQNVVHDVRLGMLMLHAQFQNQIPSHPRLERHAARGEERKEVKIEKCKECGVRPMECIGGNRHYVFFMCPKCGKQDGTSNVKSESVKQWNKANEH